MDKLEFHYVVKFTLLALLLLFNFAIFIFLYQVLPALRERHDEFMLREFVRRWANHKLMVRWLSRFFHYLDRYFIARRSLPALKEVGLVCFRDRVCFLHLLYNYGQYKCLFSFLFSSYICYAGNLFLFLLTIGLSGVER